VALVSGARVPPVCLVSGLAREQRCRPGRGYSCKDRSDDDYDADEDEAIA